ncbi:MAG: ABC transporter permease [Kosmotoga sp.]|nr:MAG: ABC transporter permease [Kosmotoga sp.]
MLKKPGVIKREQVLILGAIIGILTVIFLPLVTVRPNRLLPGEPANIFEVYPFAGIGVLSCWAIILLLSVFPRKTKGLILKDLVSLILADLAFFILVFFMGLASKNLLSQDMQFGRVSTGAAIWVSILSLYTVHFSVLKKIKNKVFIRAVITLIIPVAILFMLFSGFLSEISVVKEYYGRSDRFLLAMNQHLFIAFLAAGLGTLIGIPLGILSYRRKFLEKPIFAITNFMQTVPALALFGLLILPLALLSTRFPLLKSLGISGTGYAPALIALTLYALLPVIRNTYTSLDIIPEDIIEAGKGMGMSKRQLLTKIELPLAVPIVLAGIRLATVQAIGNTTLAALIGGGGFGKFIFQGIGQGAMDLIILGTLPVLFLAIITDICFRALISLLTPEGLKIEGEVE